MATTEQLLAIISEIADPCETLRQGFQRIATDPSTHPELKQASLDLADSIERVFQIASYIMANATPNK